MGRARMTTDTRAATRRSPEVVHRPHYANCIDFALTFDDTPNWQKAASMTKSGQGWQYGTL